MLKTHFYLLILFVILLSLYLLRFGQSQSFPKQLCLPREEKKGYFLNNLLTFNRYNCDEIKTNLSLKISGRITAITYLSDGSGVIRIDKFLIKNEQKSSYRLGDRVEAVGKPQVRVINRFLKEIWLINPAVTLYKDLADTEQERFKSSFALPGKGALKVFEFLDFFRRRTLEIYLKILPEPQASLLSGLVLGESGQLPASFWQALQKTGTLHLVAASGMNVALVAKITLNLLIKLCKRRSAYFVTLVFILIYCFLAGGSASVVRAGVMSGLALLGLAFGREAAGGWLLFLALAVMLLVRPLILFDTGFQLSAAAMAGMIWIRPVLARLLKWEVRDGKWDNEVRKAETLNKGEVSSNQKNQNISLQWSKISHLPLPTSILDTLSAQLATFPILYFTFGQLQPLAFLPNLMVIPVVAPLMMLGFLILVAGLIWLPLAQMSAWLAWPLLTYFVWVIEWWGRVL